MHRIILLALFVSCLVVAAVLPNACSCSKPVAAGEGEGEGAGAGEGEGSSASCTVDTDCVAGQVCNKGSCGALACGTDADCGSGQVCSTSSKTCVGAPCSANAACGTGKQCTNGTCTGVTCTSDAQCGAGGVCFKNGICGNSPVQDPYQAFCLGTGSVVGGGGVGAGNICTGQLAQNTFQFGFCSCADLNATGSNVTVDSFDSTKGAYGGTNVGTDGNLGVDGAATLSAHMIVHGSAVIGGGNYILPNSGNQLVDGDLYVFGNAQGSPGGTPIGHDAYIEGTIKNFTVANNLFIQNLANNQLANGAVTGTVSQLDIPKVDACPCQPDQLVDIAGIVAFGKTNNDNQTVANANANPPVAAVDPNVWAGPGNGPSTLTLPCGRFYLAGVNQTQGLTLHATDRTVLFIDGNFDASSLSVQLDDGAEVDLFITGDVNFGSATSVGDVNHPSAVRTYVAGSGGLSSQASTTFGGLLYAPNEDVQFGGSASFFGALFVHSANFGGDVNIHFDSAVRSEGKQCGSGEGEGEGEGEGAAGEGEGEGAAGEGEGEGAAGGCDQCDTTHVCGTQACIVPSGATTGTCGPCTTSIECCFPEICNAGQCVFSGG
jgi:hypothetical protein